MVMPVKRLAAAMLSLTATKGFEAAWSKHNDPFAQLQVARSQV
jgi:hypothetical protein